MDDPPVHLLRCADFEISALSNSLIFAGQALDVDRQHVRILWLLLMSPGRFFSVEQLLSDGWWSQNTYVKRDSVYQAISRLRAVLAARDPLHSILWIESRRNGGYRVQCNQPVVAVHSASFRPHQVLPGMSSLKELDGDGSAVSGRSQRSEFSHVLSSPHHLPSAPLDFTGRSDQLQSLISEEGGGVRLIGLHGGFGVGKTTLALKLAEVLSSKYPDAHCYLDLRGLSRHPLSAIDAMRHIIWSLRPDASLPRTDEALRMLYRSILYNKRVLLLFDNVRDAASIRCLSPPPSCLLIVTSRVCLAFPGMLNEKVVRFARGDAENFLLAITPRIKPQVETIAALCGYLPLALRAAGSAIAEHIDLDPADYAIDLTSARALLALTDPTEELSVEASIRLSYDLLSEDLQQRFRMLSIFPGTFDLYAVAAVWNSTTQDTQEALSAIVRHTMVTFNPVDRRYSLLDFPRLYSGSVISNSEQYRAASNHASHFEQVLAIAESLYLKGRESTKIGLELFHTEMPNIHAGQTWSASNAYCDPAAATLCSNYPEVGFYVVEFNHHPEERIAWSSAALRAAERMGDAEMKGRHLGSLGIAYWRLGNARRAADLFRDALKATKRSKDKEGRARAYRGLGLACQDLGWHRRALSSHERALQIDRSRRDKRNVGRNLNNLGISYSALGETDSAIKCHRQHLRIAKAAGDIRAESAAIGNLAVIYRKLGSLRRAITLYKRALVIDCEFGDMIGEAGDLLELGLAYVELGRSNDAIGCFERSLRLTRITGDQLREAETLFAISQARYSQGDTENGVSRAKESLSLYEELDQPRARAIRTIIRRWGHADD